MRRFLSIIDNGGSDDAMLERRLRFALAPSGDDWHVWRRGGVAVASQGCDPVVTSRGLVLGALFGKADGRPITSWGPERSDPAVEHLLDGYWGRYVAILPGERGSAVSVLRAPLGDLPLYHAVVEGELFLASDASLLLRATGRRAEIDWEQLVGHLAWRDVRTSRTCLAVVSELAGGHELHWDGRSARSHMRWSPWSFVADHRTPIHEEAAAQVREVARASVRALAGSFGRILLLLSGGLDSSIVAACLSEEGVPFVGLSFVTTDAAGDEREHARRVCDWLGAPLLERLRETDALDLSRTLSGGLPRPGLRSFNQESTRLAHLAAAEVGAGAIFNGAGGDNVFCSFQSAAPVVDRLLCHGFGPGFWRSAGEVSVIAQASLWAVLRQTLARAWQPQRLAPLFCDTSLLGPSAIAMLRGAPEHPWLEAPAKALPGRASHVRLMTYAQSYGEGLDPEDAPPTIAPLLAQPLVETCLGIASWEWVRGGHNRSVARTAFSHALPPATIARSSKGTPDSFMVELFERHRGVLREQLLPGVLAAHDIIDAAAVARVLDDPRPPIDGAFRRVLQLADAEAWVRSWMAHSG